MTAALSDAFEALFDQQINNSAPEKTRSLGMRHFELLDSDSAFTQPAKNLGIGAFQPEFDRFLNHSFCVLERFALADDAELRAFFLRHTNHPLPAQSQR